MRVVGVSAGGAIVTKRCPPEEKEEEGLTSPGRRHQVEDGGRDHAKVRPEKAFFGSDGHLELLSLLRDHLVSARK